MAELPYQTFERVTGKKWTPEARGEAYSRYGVTEKAGSAEANLALQKSLLGGGASATSTVDTTKTSITPTKEMTGATSVDGTTPTPLRYTENPVISETSKMFGSGGIFEERTPYNKEQEQSIRDTETARMKAAIDAITSSYLQERKAAEVTARGRLGRGRAISAATGVIGSPMGEASEEEIGQLNKEEMQAIEDKKNVAIGAIMTKTEDRAREIIRQRQEDAGKNAEKYISYLGGVATQAKEDLTNIAKAGSDYDTLAKTDATGLQKLLEQSGMTEAGARALFIANAPQGTYINKDKPEIVGGKAVFFKQTRDPVTGKMIITSENVDLPEGAAKKKIKSTVSRDDGIYVLYEDGTFDKVGAKSAALVKAEADARGGGGGEQLYSGLKPATATAVRGRVSTFKSEPIVANFNVINEGYDTVKSIPNDTKNPSDHQALVYAFAKIMDPNSVVREGEYATVQKYAQSWVKSYGKGIEQALAGTGFLSETAVKNMKDTLEKKYQSSKKNYDNVYKQYEKGINNLTGRGDGAQFLTDYAAAYQEKGGESGTKSSDLRSRAEQGGYDYDAMISAGNSEEDIDAALSADGL